MNADLIWGCHARLAARISRERFAPRCRRRCASEWVSCAATRADELMRKPPQRMRFATPVFQRVVWDVPKLTLESTRKTMMQVECVVWDVPKLTLGSTRKTMMQVEHTIACLEGLLVDCRCASDLDAHNCRFGWKCLPRYLVAQTVLVASLLRNSLCKHLGNHFLDAHICRSGNVTHAHENRTRNTKKRAHGKRMRTYA